MGEYYTVSFEKIKNCEYSVEAPDKKSALEYAIKLWKKNHKDIPVIGCLAHYFTKKLPKKVSEYYGTKECEKILTKKNRKETQ